MSRSQKNLELLKEYAKTKNPDVRNQLVLNNVGLVHRCYQMYFASKYPNESDCEELISAGILGLLYAIERFDVESYTVLSTYAFPYIRNQMNKLVHPEIAFSEYECEDSEIPMEEQIEDTYVFDQKRMDTSDVLEKLLTPDEVMVLHVINRTSDEPPWSVNEIAKELKMSAKEVTDLYKSGLSKVSVPCVQWYLRKCKGVLDNDQIEAKSKRSNGEL